MKMLKKSQTTSRRRVIAPVDRIPAIEPRADAWGCYGELANDGWAGGSSIVSFREHLHLISNLKSCLFHRIP